MTSDPVSCVRARWVCPIDRPPIADGWIAIGGDRIVAVGGPADPRPVPLERGRDLGRVAVLPGLINAHTHLELSWLKDRVPPAASFIGWVTQLLASRGARAERPDDQRVLAAAREAAREVRALGTIAVGDISNSLASVRPIAEAGLSGIVFHELLGFADRTGAQVADSQARRDEAAAGTTVGVSVAPHAPYSVSGELFRAIRAAVDRSELPITSVHLGESPEEIEMLRQGTGAWPGVLRLLGAWREDWTAPGTGPVEYLEAAGFLDARTLVVHGVQFDERDLERLASRGCTLVTCPRSNRWVGVGPPPIARFYASGVRVAVGTDSLASVADLNLFAELADMRWLAPSVPARQFLASATIHGASALGLENDFGTIAAGKRAALVAVDLPADVEDVEEYLVNGIEPRQIHWV